MEALGDTHNEISKVKTNKQDHKEMGLESWRRRHSRKDDGEETRTRSQAGPGSRAT